MSWLAKKQVNGENVDADTNRKRAEQPGYDVRIRRQDVLREVEERREKRCADKPQPRNPEQAQEHGPVLTREREITPGLAERVPVDVQIGLQRCGFRYETRRDTPDQRNCHAAHGKQHGAVLGQPGRHAVNDRPDQDGDKRSHFDKPVATDKFRRLEMLRQIRIFHRAKDGRMDTHEERAGVQQRRAVQNKIRATNPCNYPYFSASSKPSRISVSLTNPRQTTILPGGGSLARAR